MNIKKKIRDWLMSDSDINQPAEKLTASNDYVPSFYDDPAFRFTIRPAKGGHVIEVVSMGGGLQKRQPAGTLYIISDGQSISEELSKIFTIENLKN